MYKIIIKEIKRILVKMDNSVDWKVRRTPDGSGIFVYAGEKGRFYFAYDNILRLEESLLEEVFSLILGNPCDTKRINKNCSALSCLNELNY